MKHYEYLESEDSYEMAEEWLRRRDLEKAEFYFKRAIELNPNFIWSYVSLARIYARRKDFSRAVQVLKKASKADPEFHRLHYLMAKYAYKAGDYPHALRHIDHAIAQSAEPLYVKSRQVIEDGSGKRG